MKIGTPKTSAKKVIIITLSVTLVACLGYTVFAKYTDRWPFDNAQTAETTTSHTDSSDDTGSDVDETTTAEDKKPTAPQTSEKTPIQNEPTPNKTDKGALRANITASNQNGDNLQIRTLIEDVTTTGKCNLTLTSGDKKITESAGIQALATASTCKGFDISTNKLTPGKWRINIAITTGGKQANLSKVKTID